MIGYIGAKEQAFMALRKAEALEAKQKKISASLDYIAMMADIELEDAENMEGGDEYAQ